MISGPLDFVPLWAFFAISLLLAAIGLEAGYRLGGWRHAHVAEEKESPVGAMVAAILGLLAFMLAFTFGLAASRFDARRMTVLEEANAIGTTYLRTRLLPEPQRTEAAKLLREYVDIRVRAVEEGNFAEAVARSEQLLDLLWRQATAAAQADPHSIVVGLFVQSLNETIDVHAKRMMIGARSRVPTSIWAGLFALAAVGITAMGYQAGLSATRRTPAMLAVALAFAGVLLMIADLDRPREGSIKVDQTTMTDLQRSMHAAE